MTTLPNKEPLDLDASAQKLVASDSLDWLSVFLKHFELHFAEIIERESSSAHNPLDVAVRAFFATCKDSGVEHHSALEMLVKNMEPQVNNTSGWTDAMNERRIALIDQRIQSGLTKPDALELTRLTITMRQHLDTESQIPMEGAKALHRHLLERINNESS